MPQITAKDAGASGLGFGANCWGNLKLARLASEAELSLVDFLSSVRESCKMRKLLHSPVELTDEDPKQGPGRAKSQTLPLQTGGPLSA